MIDYRLVALRAASRLAAVAAVTIATLGSLAAPASAHAYLFRTAPTAGQVLREPPTAVRLTFSEPVQVERSALAVYDARQRRVDRRDATHPSASVNVVAVHLAPGLGRGTYAVAWRVVSIDSHPASGTFAFSVGAASTRSGAAPATTHGSRAVGLLLGVARFASYAGLALGPGALVTLLLLWPAGRRDRGARRLVALGLGVLLAATLAAYLLEGPYAAGLGPSRTFTSTAQQTVLHSHYGHVVLARLYLVAGLAVLAATALRRQRRILDAAALMVGLGVVVTFALAGHAGVGRGAGLSAVADALHVANMAVWLGALAVVLLLWRSPRAPETLVREMPAISSLALAAVVTLAVTGVGQAVRQSGSVAATAGSDYGRLVLVKVAGLLVLVGLGFLARRRVRAGTTGHRSFRRGLAAELLVAGGILLASTVLVASVPARTAYAAAVTRRLQLAALRLDVTVAPPRVGVPLRVRVRGSQSALAGLSGALTLPGSGLAPTTLRFAGGAAGRRTAGATLPAPGPWLLALTVTGVDGDRVTVVTTIPVR